MRRKMKHEKKKKKREEKRKEILFNWREQIKYNILV